MGRLSETDLQDCEHYFGFCRQAADSFDIMELASTVKGFMTSETPPEKRERLKRLLEICRSR